MTTINFYQYNGRPTTVNKQLENGTTVNGDLRQDFDILRPVITLKLPQYPNYNYCHIAALGRYYFVESITYIGNGMYEIKLSVDVLKTYETQILAAYATVTKTDNADKYLSNRNVVYSRVPQFQKLTFENTGLLNNTGQIVMITIKGNK